MQVAAKSSKGVGRRCSWGSSSTPSTPKGRVILPARFRDQLEGGAVMARALDRCLAVYPVAEFDRVAAQAPRRPRARTERAPGRADVLLRRRRDHARQAGPGRRTPAPARVRPPRSRGNGRRQLRPHRDLGRGDVPANATRRGSTSIVERRRHRRLLVSARAAHLKTTEPGLRAPSSAPRPARLLAPTPPAFSRSRLGETSRAAPVDRGAEDGIGGDAVPAKR